MNHFGRYRLRAAISISCNAMNRDQKIDDNKLAANRPVVRQSMSHLRLRKHADYKRAYAASRKLQSASMSWFLSASASAGPTARIGLTVGKVLGKAHDRNRIKRRIREALRRHTALFPAGCDLILHPRRIVLTMDFGKLEAEIVRILERANAEAKKISQGPAEAKLS
jgi:ribonuclease P protein component